MFLVVESKALLLYFPQKASGSGKLAIQNICHFEVVVASWFVFVGSVILFADFFEFLVSFIFFYFSVAQESLD